MVWNKRNLGGDFRLRYLIDTADGFRERVNEQELKKWGESFGIGLEMTLIEAIEALENVGYKVEQLEEKETLGGIEKMLLFYEGYAIENDYICDLPTMYEIHFNKKRLIKAMNYLGISNWKEFLQNEYTSDDTQEIMSYFDEHGWHYKKIPA